MPVADLPARFESVDAVDEFLSRPTPEVIASLQALDGDLMILGVGGKMGPSLASLASRACDGAAANKRIIGVSRFSAGQPRSAQVMQQLEQAGVETITCDLLNEDALNGLPEAANIIYMAGMKFGASGREAETWVLNAFLPGLIARRFCQSRIILFSSGNVYPFTPAAGGGCSEGTPPAPVGEYGQSVLGRERVFEHFSRELGFSGVTIRLNYAIDMRYGVLLDVASAVWAGQPIDLSMGYVNVIWQGDANAVALRALAHAAVPPLVLNVTGPEIVSIRALAEQFGRLLGRQPVLVGAEQPDALLSNASLAHWLFGYPRVPLGQMVEWIADWVSRGGQTLHKPTRFETRDGKY